MTVSSPRAVDTLLASLEPLSHPARITALVAHVRRNVPAGELRALLDELAARGGHGRSLAVVAAGVGGDHVWLGARLADPDPCVRAQVLSVAGGGAIPDTAFEAALRDASGTVRRQVWRAVVRRRRTALADRLIGPARENWGDTEAAGLLAGCSPETATRLLPELFHAVRGWRMLAKRHPEPLHEVLEHELAAAPAATYDARWRELENPAAALAVVRPGRVLDLLERFPPEDLPRKLRSRLPALAAVAPGPVLRLLLHRARTRGPFGPGMPEGATLERLLRSGAPEVADYLRVLAGGIHLGEALRALPPGDRLAAHRRATAGRRTGHLLDEELLALLPRAAAIEAARGMAAAIREQGASESFALRAEAFLPAPEVRERLLRATRVPDADDRESAWKLLADNARHTADPDAVLAVVTDMARLANEQDPVRRGALEALAEVPARLFTAASVPHLERILVDALESRDCSAETRSALTRLALAALGRGSAAEEVADWATGALLRVQRVSQESTPGYPGYVGHGRERPLTGREHEAFTALRPLFEQRAEQGEFAPVVTFAEAAGRRAGEMPELQEMLWRAAREGAEPEMRRRAVERWLEAPATREERVGRLLAHEPSAAALPIVRTILVRRRTDLLAHVLGERPPAGPFLSPADPWTPPVGRWVRRWTRGQQIAAERRLSALVEDDSLPMDRRVRALEAIAHIPDTGAPALLHWAHSGDVPLVEAALTALAHTDDPSGALPTLLAHTAGDRARVAVPAVVRASPEIGPHRLETLLRDMLRAPETRLTARKAAVRVAALRLPIPVAAALVAEEYAREDAHRDLRVACVTAATGLLSDERAWSVLGDAATRDRDLRRAVPRVRPEWLAAPHRARYAALVADTYRTPGREPHADAPEYLNLGRWSPWLAEATDVLVHAAADVTPGGPGVYATAGLVLAAHHPASATAPARVMALLVAADRDPRTDDAGEHRDRPARRRVEDLLRQFLNAAVDSPAAIRPAALAAAEVLLDHEDFRRQALELLAEHTDLDVPEEHLARTLFRLASLHEDRPVLTLDTLGILRDRRMQTLDLLRAGAEREVLAVAARLARHGGHAEGMIATALVAGLGRRTGWPEPTRAALRELRRHPVPDVRDTALTHWTTHG
ncbi:hypothetical protein ACN20G_26515 (plasmid) [Streptomyces sp. BI20]|uniref:hypothetical protein n=1 Tax=Streptomyces sp. BI20 TaxID=3403460 RepID=UPI003C718DE2